MNYVTVPGMTGSRYGYMECRSMFSLYPVQEGYTSLERWLDMLAREPTIFGTTPSNDSTYVRLMILTYSKKSNRVQQY